MASTLSKKPGTGRVLGYSEGGPFDVALPARLFDPKPGAPTTSVRLDEREAASFHLRAEFAGRQRLEAVVARPLDVGVVEGAGQGPGAGLEGRVVGAVAPVLEEVAQGVHLGPVAGGGPGHGGGSARPTRCQSRQPRTSQARMPGPSWAISAL